MIKKIILERELVSNECEEGIRRIENLQIIDENGPKPYDPNYSFKYGYLEDNIDFEIYDYLILVELENTNDGNIY